VEIVGVEEEEEERKEKKPFFAGWRDSMVGSWTVGCDHDASILCRSSRFLMMPYFVSIALFTPNIQ
jgi:hypothetical protein